MPVEAHQAKCMIPLRLDKQPTYHNDINVSLEQTITFTLVGTAWKLDEAPLASLHCKSYGTKPRDLASTGVKTVTTRMIDHISEMREASDVPHDIFISLDAEAGGTT